MKKLLALILCSVLLFSLSACVSDYHPTKEPADSPVVNKPVNEPENETENGDDVFGLNETAVFRDLKFTAGELTESSGQDYFVPDAGNVFVGVKFTVENISDEEQSLSSILSFDAYVDDIKCDYSFSASCIFDDGSLDGSIAPGKKLVGWYALELPENWQKLEIYAKPELFSDSVAKFVFTK